MKAKERSIPIVIGHRGNSSEAPMNTLIAVEQAIQLGVDMVEVDVHLSADDVPVLLHNSTVDETTDGSGPVSGYSFEALRDLDAGSWKSVEYAGEKIPSLAEVLDLCRGKIHLALDLKTADAIPSMLRAVADAQMREHVVICGCYSDWAEEIRQIDADITVLLNLHPEISELATSGQQDEFISRYIAQARRAGLPVLNVSHIYVTPALVRRARMQGLSVWSFTIDEEQLMRELVAMGVDAIYTNCPRRLLEVLS